MFTGEFLGQKPKGAFKVKKILKYYCSSLETGKKVFGLTMDTGKQSGNSLTPGKNHMVLTLILLGFFKKIQKLTFYQIRHVKQTSCN